MVIIRMQPGVILKKARLLPLKGYVTFLTKANRIFFSYSYTGYAKKIEKVFNMILKLEYFQNVISTKKWLFWRHFLSMLFWRHVRIAQQCVHLNADILTTI